MRVRAKIAIMLVLLAGVFSALVIIYRAAEDEKNAALISSPALSTVSSQDTMEDRSGRSFTHTDIPARSEITEILTRDSRKMLLVLLAYAAGIAAVLYLALIILICAPLDSILRALAREDEDQIVSLLGREDEFGRIADHIDKLFRQKHGLMAEVSGRKAAEEVLVDRIKDMMEAEKQLRDAQAKLVQSEKLAALSRFASGMAHEVKDPISVMLGGLRYLKAKLPGADRESVEAISRMSEAITRADMVVRDLIVFAKPSGATVESVHPNALVNDAVIFVELFKTGSGTEINIRQDLSDKEILIDVDKNQIQQALLNVLLNAVEAMPSGGDIFVRTSEDAMETAWDKQGKAACVIEISDTGIGIPKGDIGKVFEPFFTTKPSEKSAGLGLSVVKSMVEKNKGLVSIASEEGKGTKVRLVFPVAKNDKGSIDFSMS